MNKIKLVLICLALVATNAGAKIERSMTARAHFQKAHPCPANGKKVGACPGYVVDHIQPLCAGGADDPSNMQWQEYKASLEKDKLERKQCAAYRKGK